MESRWAPSRLAWSLALTGLALAIAGAWIPAVLSWLLPCNVALVALIAVSGIVGSRSRHFSADRAHRPTLAARSENQVSLRLASTAKRGLRIEVLDELPRGFEAAGNELAVRLPAQGSVDVEYAVVPHERGKAEFPGTWLRFSGPLGLARVVQRLPNPTSARVFPNMNRLRDFELLRRRGKLETIGVRRNAGRGVGRDFAGLRDYNEDDIRHVHWGATARRGRLVVKEYEPERNQAVVVCLDLGRHMLGEVRGLRKVEPMLDAAVLLVHAAAREGDMVGLMAFDEDVRTYIGPKKGRAQATQIAEAVHELRPIAAQPHYRSAFAYLGSQWRRRAFLVVLTDAEEEDQARELAAALRPLRHRHLVMVVRLVDSDARSARLLEPSSAAKLLDRAAGVWYLEERERADVVLRQSGIETLESEPESLTGDLVSAYLRFKLVARI